MKPLTIQIFCEVARGGPGSLADDVLCAALRAELAVLSADLRLDVEFAVSAHNPQVGEGRPPRPAALRLHVDGSPLDWYRVETDLEQSVIAALHANLQALITPRFADHVWEASGGTPVSPPAFVMLLKQLVRHGLRPDRVYHAVPTWSREDPLHLFEEALGGASRKVLAHVHPDRRPELLPAFALAEDSPAMMMVDGLFYELGILTGECEVVADSDMPAGLLRVQINDLRSAPRPLLSPGEHAVNDTVEGLTRIDVKGRAGINPANGTEIAIVAGELAARCEAAALTTWDPGGWTILTISSEVRRMAASVLSLDALRFQMNKLKTAFPHVVSHVEQGVGLERFARALRHLLSEEICIRNLRHIVHSLAMNAPPATEPIDFNRYIVFASTYTALRPGLTCAGPAADPEAADIAEAARIGLKRYISHKYTRGGNTLVVYLLNSEIEERLRQRQPLSGAERRRLLQAIDAELESSPATAQAPCLLTSLDVRRRLRSEIEARFPGVPVLSYQELSPDLNIQPLARISLDDATEADPLDAIDTG